MPRPADLVVVSSPLQYMNAVEWRLRRGDRTADLVLLGDRADGAAGVDLLMARHPPLWRAIVRAEGRPRPASALPPFGRDLADLAHRAALARLARRLAAARYETIATGDHRNISQRHLAANIPHEVRTLLDDGSITPQAARARAGAPDPRFAPRWFRTALARRVFGDPPPAEPAALGFFTIYGRLIAGAVGPADRVEPHAYDGWRGSKPFGPVGGEAWILGGNHVEAGICAAEDYAELILGGAAALQAEAPGRPLVYRAHRGEAPAKVAALAAAGGFVVAASPLPVEAAYLEAPARPALVAVVASSAADTLSVLDPELAVVRFALPERYLKRQRDHILAVVSAHHAFNPALRVLVPAPGDRRPR